MTKLLSGTSRGSFYTLTLHPPVVDRKGQNSSRYILVYPVLHQAVSVERAGVLKQCDR